VPNYVIVTDSSCDLNQEIAEQLELKILPLSFHIDGKEHKNELDWPEITPEKFYKKLREGSSCTTSAVNMESFKNLMETYLKKGQDVLCPCFSSGLSGTYQAAKMAGEELTALYPDRKIYVIDTLCASLGQGLLIWYAANQRLNGKSIDEVRDWIEENKLHLCHWFTVDDLNFLKRGGRVNSAAALFGTVLGIKPVMHVDNNGRLIPISKVRGRKASLDALVDHMAQTAIDPKNQTVFISQGDSKEDAEYVANQIKERLGTKTVFINFIGPVIGAHSGPGTIALFFLGTER